MFLAFILLYQCDDCAHIAAIKSDKDQHQFTANWHDGLLYQFCPSCKAKTENKEKILRDSNHEFYLNNLEKMSNVKPAFIN